MCGNTCQKMGRVPCQAKSVSKIGQRHSTHVFEVTISLFVLHLKRTVLHSYYLPKSGAELVQPQWPQHTTTQRHPPVGIESFVLWLCSWCPSSNAFATWNSLTRTMWSWSIIWWRYYGGDIGGSMPCSGVSKEKMSFTLMPPISSNLFGNKVEETT